MPNIFWSIRNKLVGMMLITLFPAILAGSFLSISVLQKHYTKDIARTEGYALHAVEEHLEYVVQTARQDLVLLAGLKTVQDAFRELARHKRSDGYDFFPLAQLFPHFLRTRDLYDQIRVLDADGWEVFRGNLEKDGVEIVPHSRLQYKGERYYFQQVQKSAPGQIYVSPIDLNRENGQIEQPFKPMLRIVAPVFDAGKRFAGALVLNFYAEKLFKDARDQAALPTEKGSWIITDQQGWYLYHPDSEKCWGGPKDLNTGEGLEKDYPDQAGSLVRDGYGELSGKDGCSRAYAVKVHLWPDRTSYLSIIHVIPGSIFTEHILASIQTILLPLVLIALCAGLIAWTVGKRISCGITTLLQTVQKFSKGDFTRRVHDLSSRDEIGVLGRQFNIMADTMASFHARLEEKVASRTQALKQMNDELEANKTRLQAILDNTVDGIVTINATGIIQTFNKGAAKIFGYTSEESIGQNVTLLMPEKIGRMHDGFLLRHRHQDSGTVLNITREVIARRKDGTPFPLSMAVSKVPIGDAIFFTGILRDMSEFKETERRFKATFEQAAVGICHIGLEGQYIRVNDKLCRMWGYSKAELESLTIFETTWATSLPRTRDLWTRFLSGELTSFSVEKRYRTKIGEPWWGQLTMSAVGDENGVAEYFIVVIEDINTRKRGEEELQKLSMIAKRTDNLVATTDVNGLITWVNDAFSKKTGYTFEEVVGRKPGSFLQGEDTDPVTVQLMAQHLAHQQGFATEILNYDKWHNPYWVSLE
ncbi:MAG: PAS domain S-box protein, partial [Desulfoplanes sp.]|nr:PAS domain S-box protein [Desulfoplanes sp.]